MKHMFLALFALASAFALSAPAEAGCQGTSGYRHSYSYNSYTPTYHNYEHHDYPVSTFLAIPIPVYPVFGVGYGQGSDIAALQADIAAIKQALVARTQVQPAPQPAPPVASQSLAVPQLPQASGKPAFDAQKMYATVMTSCAKCHNASTAKKGLSLLSADGKSLAALPKSRLNLVFRKVARGDMPPAGHPPITQEGLDLFDAWAESAAD